MSHKSEQEGHVVVSENPIFAGMREAGLRKGLSPQEARVQANTLFDAARDYLPAKKGNTHPSFSANRFPRTPYGAEKRPPRGDNYKHPQGRRTTKKFSR